MTTKTDIRSLTKEALRDFFIAGIRGLGTWGAAWYLDRRYRELRKIKHNENVQLLLEIEYKNGRISNVIDVSSKDAEYFKERNKDISIKKDIHDHIHGGSSY